ncbi:MAG: glycosyltransferase, partial [Bryobacteraceae bacterium]|nr:glycosyltransferase [Bryobacteraceae bacterium]
MRIGINALYLIPGGVGGTETYLRCLVAALERLPHGHEIVVFTNRETGALGRQAEVQPVRARIRPWRILYEQMALPAVLRRHGIDVVLNPGFTAPLLADAP